MPEGRRPSLGETYSEVANLVHAQEEVESQQQQRLICNNVSSSRWTEFKRQGRLFLELALPTCLLSVGTNISPLLTASVVGLKFGQTYLSAFTLANLTGNLCTYSLLWGLLTAADTLSPQAFGKGDYPEVGYLAMRGITLSAAIVVPSNVLLFTYLQDILLALGQDPEAAAHAQAWYRIFVVALPFVVVFTVTWKFLSAQHVMVPLMCVSLFSCCIVLPVALELLTSSYGFLGSAMAYVTFQATQTILLFVYLYWKRPHVAETWPGLLQKDAWHKALQWKPLMEYLNLGAGGMFAQSEWIFWEALGLIIGKLGVLELSTHTIPNQIIMIACLAPFAFGTALAIRMGITLTQQQAQQEPEEKGSHAGSGKSVDGVAKTQTMVVCITVLCTIVFGFLAIVMYVYQDWIYSFFTTEADVIAMAEKIWWKVCVFSWNVAIFALLSGVATGLGMQWSLGAVNFLFLWVFGVPVTYHATITMGGGLAAAWTWINVPYLLMNVTLLGIFVTTDWYKIQRRILLGELVQDPEVAVRKQSSCDAQVGAEDESTCLLSGKDDSHQNSYSGTTAGSGGEGV